MAGLSDIAKRTAKGTGVTIATATNVLYRALTEIEKVCLDEDGRVTIPSFGVFYRYDRPERQGRHPVTHEEITIPAKSRLAFKRSLNAAD